MTLPPQTIQFLIAIGFGVALGASTQGLGASVAWVIVGAFVLSVITCMLEGRRLPRSMQSPYGVTFPRGMFTYLFLGTITTIAIPAILVRLLTGGTR